jgi:lysophospholipase L1-like esterase
MIHPKFFALSVVGAVCLMTSPVLLAQPNPGSVPPAGGASSPAPGATNASFGNFGVRRGGGGGGGGGINWSNRLAEDFNDLKFFTNANAKLPPPIPGEKRVVFIGDSITENWQRGFNQYFPGKTNYIGRGHTSETTQQMLVRFRQDILDLQPKVVVIMAGVNDVAGNTGEYHQKVTEDCFKSMFDLAEINHIKVILISTLPCNTFFWQRSITDGADKVFNLVQWEKQYSAQRGIEYVDAYAMMADDQHHMKAGLSMDSVHPTQQGYQMLSKPVGEVIEKVLATLN